MSAQTWLPDWSHYPEQLTPLYLRRPDAVEPGARKKVAR